MQNTIVGAVRSGGGGGGKMQNIAVNMCAAYFIAAKVAFLQLSIIGIDYGNTAICSPSIITREDQIGTKHTPEFFMSWRLL